MISIQRILVPIDFSEPGRRALRYGCALADRFGSELHLLHVVEEVYPMVPEAGMLYPAQTDYVVQLQKSAAEALEKVPAAGECSTTGGIVRVVETGTPYLEIVRYAHDKEIDLIVVGTHGRTGLVHMLMGSVAEKIVRKSPCPVLTVQPEGHDFVKP